METKKITPESVQWFDDRFYRIELEKVEFFPSVTTVLGVTSKPFLNRWRGDIGNRDADLRSREAADKGSRIHHACQSIMEGGLAIFNPRYRPVYDSQTIQDMRKHYEHKLHVFENQEEWIHVYRFHEWVKEVKPIHIASEVVSYDLENKVAGSSDYLWYIKEGKYRVSGSKPLHIPEGLYVQDLKTGKNLDDDYRIQVAKYRNMINTLISKGLMTFEQEGLDLSKVFSGLIIHTQAMTRTGLEGLNTKIFTPDELDQDAEYFDKHLLPVWRRKNEGMTPKVFDLPTSITLNGTVNGSL